MFNTNKINKDLVAVSYSGADGPGIAIRKSGKVFYGKEELAVDFVNGSTLVINEHVLKRYGLKLQVNKKYTRPMCEIKFKYKNKSTNNRWKTVTCLMRSFDECKAWYNLDDPKTQYKIISNTTINP